MTKNLKIEFSLKSYTYLLLASSLLAAQVVSIDLGFMQLSPYRTLILLSPFIVLKLKKSSLSHLNRSLNYQYFLFLFFWVIYSIFSIIWIENFLSWGKMFSFLFTGFITTWFMGWHLTRKEDIIKAIRIVEVFSIIIGVLAIYELITGDYMFISGENLIFYGEQSLLHSAIGIRIPVTIFDNPNNYSLFLLFSIFFALALSKIKKTKTGRFLSLLIAVFLIFLLFTTQSRSGVVGLIIGFSSYFLLKAKVSGFKIIWKILLIIILVFMFAIPWLSSHRSFFEELITFDISKTGGSDSIRINLIKNGFLFLFDSLLMGVGLGNIEYYMQYKAVYNTNGIINIHNWWMELLVSSGIFVFLFYTKLYLKNMWRLYLFSFRKMDYELQHLSICFFSLMAAFLIGSLGVSSLMYNEWFWPMMAILMCFLNLFSYNLNKLN